MKEELLKKLAEHQDDLLRIIGECVRYGDPMDTLQDFYLFCYEKDYKVLTVEQMFPEGKIHTGLVYRLLSNFVLGRVRKDADDAERLKESNSIYTQRVSLDRFSVEEKIAYEYNMNKLDAIKEMTTEEDFQAMIDIQSSNLLAKYTDKDGNRDMEAYHNKRYLTTKEMNRLKNELDLSDYKRADDIDFIETLKD